MKGFIMKTNTRYLIGSLIVAASLVSSPGAFAKGVGGKQGGDGGQGYSQSQGDAEQSKKQQGAENKQSQHQKQNQNQNRHKEGGNGQQGTEQAAPAE